MRLFKLNRIASLTALTVAFMSGYFVGDRGSDRTNSNQAKTVGGDATAVKVSQSPRQNNLIQAAQARGANISANTVSEITSELAGDLQSQSDDFSRNPSAAELLATMESLVLKHKSDEEIRGTKEFQQLLSLLAADPGARKRVLERLLNVNGTSLGDTLSQALALSGGQDIPEIKAAATRLLRGGTAEQRLNALQMLGQASGNDPSIRSSVLEILRSEAGTNPKLAMAAMSSLSQKGVVSQGDYQAVVGSIALFVHSQDPEVRQTSLQALSNWSDPDPAALQTFTEAAYDSDAGVRALAVSVLGQGGFDYESVRDTLISTLQNPTEDLSVKAAAQQALGHFPLDEQALAIYRAYASDSVNHQSSMGFN